jgi:signal peptidase II
MKNNTRIWLILLSGCLFCFDQTLKYLAQTHQTYTWYIVEGTVGWEFFANPGIAFGISFPLIPLLITTPLILWFFFRTQKQTTLWSHIGFALICAGALSNMLDRVLYGYVIDYLRLIISMFNLADVYILVGVIILLQQQRKK